MRPAAKGGLVEKLGVDVATAWASPVWRIALLATAACTAFLLMPLAFGAISYQSQAAGSRLEVDRLRRSSTSMLSRYNMTTGLLQKRLKTDGQKLDAALKRIHAMEADGAALRQSNDALESNHSALRHNNAELNAELARLRAELGGQQDLSKEMQRDFATQSEALRQKASEENLRAASASTELGEAKAAAARKQKTIGHHREHAEHLSTTLSELLELEELFKAKMARARGEIAHVTDTTPSPPPAHPPPARRSPPPPPPRAKFTGYGTNAWQQAPRPQYKPWEKAVAEERKKREAAAAAKQKVAPIGQGRRRARRN